MPKFDKPKVNKPKVTKSQVDKSKSGDRPNQSKPLLSESELPPVQLDETIVAGTGQKQLNDFQRMVLAEVSKMSSQFGSQFDNNNDDDDDDDDELDSSLSRSFDVYTFESKISQILGTEDIDVTLETIVKYFDYLKQNIQLPLQVTGLEDFPWEEYYVIGNGSPKEYARLKKTQPSYTDTFTINEWKNSLIQDNSISVNMCRVGDRKKFLLPLEDLKVVDETSANYQLLDDYIVWVVNYC